MKLFKFSEKIWNAEKMFFLAVINFVEYIKF